MKVAQHWRLNDQRYQMNGAVDGAGNVNFPPRPEIAQRTDVHYDLLTTVDYPDKQPATVPVRFVSVA